MSREAQRLGDIVCCAGKAGKNIVFQYATVSALATRDPGANTGNRSASLTRRQVTVGPHQSLVHVSQVGWSQASLGWVSGWQLP